MKNNLKSICEQSSEYIRNTMIWVNEDTTSNDRIKQAPQKIMNYLKRKAPQAGLLKDVFYKRMAKEIKSYGGESFGEPVMTAMNKLSTNLEELAEKYS